MLVTSTLNASTLSAAASVAKTVRLEALGGGGGGGGGVVLPVVPQPDSNIANTSRVALEKHFRLFPITVPSVHPVLRCYKSVLRPQQNAAGDQLHARRSGLEQQSAHRNLLSALYRPGRAGESGERRRTSCHYRDAARINRATRGR